MKFSINELSGTTINTHNSIQALPNITEWEGLKCHLVFLAVLEEHCNVTVFTNKTNILSAYGALLLFLYNVITLTLLSSFASYSLAKDSNIGGK